MKKLLYLTILLFISVVSFGQNQKDSIQIKKSIGTVFLLRGIVLSPKQLLEVTKYNSIAYEEMLHAKTNYDVSTVFGFAGGMLVGFPLGTAIGGGKPNWALAGIGAGLIVISVPFSIAYTKRAKNAIKLYNDNLKQTSLNHLNFNIGVSSIGIKVLF